MLLPSIHNNKNSCTEDVNHNHPVDNKLVLLQRCLQMSRDEFISYIQQEYNIHSAYMVVLTAAMEQVAHFQETKYPYDSLRSSNTNCENSNNTDHDHHAELHFEEILQFGRMTGFTLPIIESTTTTGTSADHSDPPGKILDSIRQDILQILLDRIRTLGNTKLLGRGPSTTKSTDISSSSFKDVDSDDDKDEVEDDNEGNDVDGLTNRARSAHEPRSNTTSAASTSSTSTKCGIPTPSFQSDRRMIRLILARYWADLLRQRYYTDTQSIVCHDDDTASCTTQIMDGDKK